MNRGKWIATAVAVSMMLAGGSVTSVCAASTQEQMEAAQEGKAQSESDLAKTQERIEILENQRGDLENHLSQLSQQYEELSGSLEDLADKAQQKKKELKLVKKELKNEKEKEKEQYESMKIRISYMYENSKGNLLTTLLSADSFTDLLNRAENFMQISKYDREMLKKYEQTKEKVEDQKLAIKVEQEAIAQLQAQSAAKRREVENLAASVQEEIAQYGQEIDQAQGEAAILLERVSSQSDRINALMAKAEEEAEEARKAAEAELARQQAEEEKAAKAAQQTQEEAEMQDTAFDEMEETVKEEKEEIPEIAEEEEIIAAEEEISTPEITQEPEETETALASDSIPEESAQPDTGESSDAPATAETSSGAGTYLGEFTLTAYCSCSICCGSWSGGGTASGTRPTAGRTVAMGGVPFGTKLLINGNVYTVEDRGTGYGHVDIYMDSHSAASQFGSQKASVYQLNN